MKTRCLILDDEPLARALIYKYIQQFEKLEVVVQCASPEEAMLELGKKLIDLIFLDVHLPKISGIEFLKSLANPPHVIITTAHAEYAWEGFELDVVDYLLKPIRFERFTRAIHKYFQLSNTFHQEFNAGNPCIFVRENKKVVKIHLCDIQYIEGLGEYIKIYTEKKKVVTKMGMSQIEEKLPHRFFLRVHKSYIISIAHIDAYTNNSIEINETEIPVGRSYKNAVFQKMNFEGSVTRF